MGGFSKIFLFPEGIFTKEPDQRMKVRRTNKVGKFEFKKAKNKGVVSKNVVRVAMTPHSPNRNSECSNFFLLCVMPFTFFSPEVGTYN